MKVLLRQDVADLGRRGDVVVVRDGYARNHLIPNAIAIKASASVESQAAAMRRARAAKEARQEEQARELAERLEAASVRVEVRSGAAGRLFGSVTAADIAAAVHAQLGVDLDRRRVEIAEPIRSLGSHVVRIHLGASLERELAVEVVALGSQEA